MRIIAVDWSGARVGAERRIWLAEADTESPGRLVRLECGRSREQLAAHLMALPAHTVIGLDFAFSFPAWYLDQLGLSTAEQLWAHVAVHGEDWLRACAPPLWGRKQRPRPDALDGFRRTEHSVRKSGFAPKSIFQIGGAGSVGSGSIRGMPMLHELHAHGARIWPFDPPGWPRVLEIYPRMLTGAVVKSNAAARQAYLAAHYPGLPPIATEDAFDAAVSALQMLAHHADLETLPEEADGGLRREGRIWYPSWRADVT